MAIPFTNTGSGDGGDMVPILKYNAKAGRIYRLDRRNDGTGWVTDEVEITNDFNAVMDMENIEVGWLSFNSGAAPDIRVVPLGEDAGQRPTDKHKEGFRVMLKLSKSCAGEGVAVREMATTAGSVKQAFSDLHDAYLEGVKANPGKLPIVRLAKVTAVTTTNGGQKQTNYAPEFEITGWAPRPNDLIFRSKARSVGNASAQNGTQNGVANGAVKQAASPPATGSTRAAPPAAQQQPALADAANDFG